MQHRTTKSRHSRVTDTCRTSIWKKLSTVLAAFTLLAVPVGATIISIPFSWKLRQLKPNKTQISVRATPDKSADVKDIRLNHRIRVRFNHAKHNRFLKPGQVVKVDGQRFEIIRRIREPKPKARLKIREILKATFTASDPLKRNRKTRNHRPIFGDVRKLLTLSHNGDFVQKRFSDRKIFFRTVRGTCVKTIRLDDVFNVSATTNSTDVITVDGLIKHKAVLVGRRKGFIRYEASPFRLTSSAL